MSFSDTIFLFFLALVLFGPKKLPEMARQAGRLLAELRRASNEFRSQIESEIAQVEIEKRSSHALQTAGAAMSVSNESIPRTPAPLATLAAPNVRLPPDALDAKPADVAGDSAAAASIPIEPASPVAESAAEKPASQESHV
jgi:sec-independent protein translocase protein TatB